MLSGYYYLPIEWNNNHYRHHISLNLHLPRLEATCIHHEPAAISFLDLHFVHYTLAECSQGDWKTKYRFYCINWKKCSYCNLTIKNFVYVLALRHIFPLIFMVSYMIPYVLKKYLSLFILVFQRCTVNSRSR